MKKILLAIGVVVLIAVVAMATNEANSPDQPPASGTSAVSEENNMDQGETSEMAEDAPLAEGEERYIVQSGMASYTVNKQWLEKDHEDVTGTTEDVSGTAVYNTEEKSVTELSATVDSQTFVTGSNMRDKEVAEWLGAKIMAKLVEPIKNVEGDFSESVDMEVTINETTQTLTFAVTGELQENGELKLSGTSELSLEAFNIEAPSALGLYGVADDVDLSFEVMAQKQ